MFDKYEMKNAIDKIFSPENALQSQCVKTNFSKQVLDEVSETTEEKKIVDCAWCATWLWLLCVHVQTNPFLYDMRDMLGNP